MRSTSKIPNQSPNPPLSWAIGKNSRFVWLFVWSPYDLSMCTHTASTTPPQRESLGSGCRLSSLKDLARTRMDIFGMETDEERRKREEEDERERRRRGKDSFGMVIPRQRLARSTSIRQTSTSTNRLPPSTVPRNWGVRHLQLFDGT
jgi:hypothetical protein